MKVREIMTTGPEGCRCEDNLSAVAMIMWRRDCGFVPVLDGEGHVIGVLTDRDICMAVTTRHLRPEDLTAGDVMTRVVAVVETDDAVRTALQTMKRARARRLPVVDHDGVLHGIVSINDLVRATRPSRQGGTPRVDSEDVLDVLRVIGAHPAVEGVAKVGAVSEEMQPA